MRALSTTVLLLTLAAVAGAGADEVAADSGHPAPSREAAWAKVEMAAAAHGPLLERQGRIPLELSKDAVGLAVTALSPDLMGVVGEVSASYDSMESPSEVVVTVTETGIMDDDLLGVRHSVSLAKNRNGQWRIVGYEKGELRRKHLQ